MGNGSSGSSSSQGGSAGVGEEVQYLDGASGVSDLFPEPIPVGSLFREKTCVLEAEWFQIKGQIVLTMAQGILDGPLLRQVEELPLAFSSVAIR